MSKVTLRHVYKVYEGGVRAVNDFNLEIADKEFIVFVGPSGCGKSTTLRMIAGLETITSGQLFIDDVKVNDVESKDRDIAMVFQNYALYPHMTVYQNMAFGLKLKKTDPKEIDERVKNAAKILEIEDLLSRKPKALSGGQRQRVALGRAIVREPKVFLLDEPLSNLDAKLRVQMRTEITKLHKRLATTFIYVTHDQTEAMTMGDRIVVMKQGFIQQVDTPVNLYEHPANLFVATFLGSPQMNILPCHLEEKEGQLSAYLNNVKEERVIFPPLKAKQLSDRNYINQDVLLGIRPEHIKLGDKGIKGLIEVIEQLGDETIVHVKIEGKDDDIVIKGAATGKYKLKQEVCLDFEMEQVHLFDAKTSGSIMGIPKENRFPCQISPKKATFGNNEFVFSDSYAKRIFERKSEGEKAYLCFAPQKTSLTPFSDGIRLKAKVDFVDKKTDSSTVFLKIDGLEQYLVMALEAETSLKEGQESEVYVKEEDISLKNEEGDFITSREIILPNLAKAFFKTEGEKTAVTIGKNKLVFPKMNVTDGEHTFILHEDKAIPVFSKKALKALGRKDQPVYDKKRLIKASAYDEEQLGKKNAIFVQLSGFGSYATFLVDADFSVYKAPKFSLYLEDGAISIVK